MCVRFANSSSSSIRTAVLRVRSLFLALFASFSLSLLLLNQ